MSAMPVKSLYTWQIAACNKIQAPPAVSFPDSTTTNARKGPLLGSSLSQATLYRILQYICSSQSRCYVYFFGLVYGL